ncbi:MAG: hypothetical protein GY861_24370 [bacterium]|nr:hypothetical protein [bacterium]
MSLDITQYAIMKKRGEIKFKKTPEGETVAIIKQIDLDGKDLPDMVLPITAADMKNTLADIKNGMKILTSSQNNAIILIKDLQDFDKAFDKEMAKRKKKKSVKKPVSKKKPIKKGK